MNQETQAPAGLALLLLDAQTPFLDAVENSSLLRRRITLALGAAQLLGIPVSATEQVPDKLGLTETAWRSLIPSECIFQKTTFSAFGAKGFSSFLKERTIKHLLITGVEIPICVYQTAIEAVQSGLTVTILADAVGARRKEDAECAANALRQQNGIYWLPTETIFYALLQDARHPRFRDFTQLVKNS